MLKNHICVAKYTCVCIIHNCVLLGPITGKARVKIETSRNTFCVISTLVCLKAANSPGHNLAPMLPSVQVLRYTQVRYINYNKIKQMLRAAKKKVRIKSDYRLNVAKAQNIKIS